MISYKEAKREMLKAMFSIQIDIEQLEGEKKELEEQGLKILKGFIALEKLENHYGK